MPTDAHSSTSGSCSESDSAVRQSSSKKRRRAPSSRDSTSDGYSNSSSAAPRRSRKKRNRARYEAIATELPPPPHQPPPLTAEEILEELEEEISSEEVAIPILRPSALVFVHQPGDAGDTALQLDESAPANRVFLAHERSVALLRAVLEPSAEGAIDEASRSPALLLRCRSLEDTLNRIKTRGRQYVTDRSHNASFRQEQKFDNTVNFNRSPLQKRGHGAIFAFIIVVAHLIAHLTYGNSRALLLGLDIAVASVALISHSVAIPHDIRTALSWFPIDADFESIACCPNPECCKLHFLDGHNRLLERCDAQFGSWKCGWELSKKYMCRGTEHFRPRRTFHYQSVTAWVGKLLARPGMEERLSEYVDRATACDTSAGFSDIWQSSFFRDFQWAHGSKKSISAGFTSPTSGNDLRLLFSIAIDWFTAHSGKQAKKKWSIGAIYLVCQNLPLEIRFREENVCLIGIIPGRTKPLGHAINWFLSQLVDELVAFYEQGVWYNQTSLFPSGRLVWAALGPVVCDLDAARGVAGMGAVGHRFLCSVCSITRDKIADFDTEFSCRGGGKGFPLWTSFVDAWTGAESDKARAKVFKQYGLRWTELARLRYWDPFRFLVIDPMHNLFLGLFRRHLRHIWRMDLDTCGWGDEAHVDPGELAYAKSLFRQRACTVKSLDKLAHATVQGLAYCCESIPEETIRGKKKDLLTALLSWKSAQPSGSQAPALVLDEDDRTLAKEWLLTQPKMWTKMHKPELVELCRAAEIQVSKGLKKGDLTDALQARLDSIRRRYDDDDDGGDSEPEATVKRATRKKTGGVIIGRTLLSALSKDITRTIVPDWIDRAPTNVGTTKHGKLSANQWRVFCTIHCIVTLIRIWGVLRNDSRQFLVLENFVYLVKAVDLATRRTTTSARRKEYTILIKLYLNGLKALFPAASIAPNHHLSLHLPRFLKLFGPPHSWWAFPYERYNGILQKIKTNDIIGRMEKTIMEKFLQATRLKCLVFDNLLPDNVKPLTDWALAFIRKQYTGFLLVDNDTAAMSDQWTINPTSKIKMSSAMRRALVEANLVVSDWKVAQSLHQRGMTFSAYDCLARDDAQVGNTIVHIKVGDATTPARIEHIVYKRGAEDAHIAPDDARILVRLYEDLSPADLPKDPYRQWQQLRVTAADGQEKIISGIDCHLRYDAFAVERLLRISDVVSHAAKCPYEPSKPGMKLANDASVFVGLNRT